MGIIVRSFLFTNFNDIFSDYKTDSCNESILYSSEVRDISGIKCKLEINKAGTLEFDIVNKDGHNDSFEPYLSYILVEDEYEAASTKSTQSNLFHTSPIFFGRVIKREQSFGSLEHVTCEGFLAVLMDAPMIHLPVTEADARTSLENFTKIGYSPNQAFGAAVNEAYRYVLSNNNFRYVTGIDSIPSDYHDLFVLNQTIYNFSAGQTVGDFVLSELVEKYGGLLFVNYCRCLTDGSVNSSSTFPYNSSPPYLIWRLDPSRTLYGYEKADQYFRYGENILSIDRQSNIEEMVTGILPLPEASDSTYWQYSQCRDYNGDLVSYYTLYPFVSSELQLEYGNIFKTVSFSNITSNSQLIEVANLYVDTFLKDWPDDLTIRGIDMHFVDETIPRIFLMDRVAVIDKDGYSIGDSFAGLHIENDGEAPDGRVMICKSIEYDFEHPENNTYVIGPILPIKTTDARYLTKSKT